MEEKRMTFGTCLKTYFRQCLEVFKHPKLLLPTIILSVLWIGLGILQNHVERNFPLSIINFLTFAQGGLYGGILGTIGGILGKIVVAAIVNAMVVPLFYKKNPFANLKQGFKDIFTNIKFESKEASSMLLKGSGVALLLYSIFNFTQSFENSLVGILSVFALVMAAARKGGFLWSLVLSFMNTVTKGKIPLYQRLMRLLTGLALGFSLGVVLSAIGPMWAAGSLGLIALIVGWIIGKKNSKKTVAATVLILLFLIPKFELFADSTGVWKLVDVKTEMNPTNSVKDSDGQLCSVKLSGTTTDFRIDYTYGNDAGYFTGNISPIDGSYAPGDYYTGESKVQIEKGTPWQLITWFRKIRLKSYYGTNHDEGREVRIIDLHDGTFLYQFPTLEEVGSDNLILEESVVIRTAYIRTLYYFEWDANGKADNHSNSANKGWSNLFGTNGKHTPDGITILIVILGALGGLGGGLGGVLGSGTGGGIPTGDIPGGEGPAGDGPEPKNEPTLFKKYVRDNPDGTKTYIDPATGEKHTLYPKYNTETGAFSHWENENDTSFDEDKLNDWLAWRERNNETFAQDAAQAQQNLNEQRAMNQAQNEYDRARGSSATADAYKAFKEQSEKDFEHEMRLRDLAWKHGVANEEELKKVLKQDMHNALQENAEAMNNATYWNDWVTSTEVLETTCDKFINVAGETSPMARQVKNYYTFAKSVLKHGSMGVVKGQGFGGLAAELGVGVAEGGLGVLQNEEMTGVFGESFTGGLVKSGVNVGAEMGKTLLNDLLDPNKSAKDIMDDLTTASINRIGYETIGKITSGLGGYASDTSQYGLNTVTAFNQEAGTHEAITNEIAKEINRYRQSSTR